MITDYDSPRGSRVAGEQYRDRTDQKRDPGLQQGGASTENPPQAGAEESTPAQQQQSSGSTKQAGSPIFKVWAWI